MGGAAVQPVVGVMETSPEHFELHLSLPHDVRFADTVRSLAVQAARYAGCVGTRADAFGSDVADLARRCLADDESGPDVLVVLRRAAGPIEVSIGARTVTLDL